ncbi:MAG: endonuclease NucS [Thermoproteus sp.]
MQRLLEPDARDAAAFLNTYKKRGLIAIFCLCEGKYEGRAAAELPKAPYLVILKPDGSLLVHGAEKSTPLIWNPPGSSNMALVQDGALVLKSLRSKPAETVVLKVDKIYEVVLFDAGSLSVYLQGSERDVVQALVRKPEVIEPGFKVVGVEVPVETGHIDILGVDREGRYVVVEVKRDVADHHAVFQLKRYVETVSKTYGKARGILVAADITTSAFHYLREHGLEFIKIKPRELIEQLLNRSDF